MIPPPSWVVGASFDPDRAALPVCTSADLTWATVHVWRCRSTATAPATCGEAMLVPLNRAHVPWEAGTEDATPTPGAATSGFMRSDTGAGPAEEKDAIRPPTS